MGLENISCGSEKVEINSGPGMVKGFWEREDFKVLKDEQDLET